jgi:uncharacterized protein DUF1918
MPALALRQGECQRSEIFPQRAALRGWVRQSQDTESANARRLGEIVEVRGTAGAPPYLVRFPDGRETLVFPGPDCVVEHPAEQA